MKGTKASYICKLQLPLSPSVAAAAALYSREISLSGLHALSLWKGLIERAENDSQSDLIIRICKRKKAHCIRGTMDFVPNGRVSAIHCHSIFSFSFLFFFSSSLWICLSIKLNFQFLFRFFKFNLAIQEKYGVNFKLVPFNVHTPIPPFVFSLRSLRPYTETGM